ncbi:MAG: hypothetical protein LBI55_01755 [Oscillospiraceae bacterium]|nr:hypothetical protein [Oscillospiraceae bacterium]
MSGIENIVKKIENKTDEVIQKIFEEADKKILEINLKVKKQTDSRIKKIFENSNIVAEFTKSKGKSSLEDQKKKNILKTKRKIATDIIEKARIYLKNLPDKEYFEIILKIIKKFALPKSGEILFSQNDLSRLPQNFDSKLSKILENKNKKLTISKKTNSSDFGFVLIYGSIEENCTIDALFEEKYDVFLDTVIGIIF